MPCVSATSLYNCITVVSVVLVGTLKGSAKSVNFLVSLLSRRASVKLLRKQNAVTAEIGRSSFNSGILLFVLQCDTVMIVILITLMIIRLKVVFSESYISLSYHEFLPSSFLTVR